MAFLIVRRQSWRGTRARSEARGKACVPRAGQGELARPSFVGAGAAIRRMVMATYDETRSGSDTLARDETFDLISSQQVDGTAVYDRGGEKLGKLAHFM